MLSDIHCQGHESRATYSMQQSLEIRLAIVFPSNRFLAPDLPLLLAAAAAAAAAATFLLFIIFLISGSLLTMSRVSSSSRRSLARYRARLKGLS